VAQITQIQVRRDTAANWTSVNPTLSAGEIGFETDTGKFKIGTGSNAWTVLTYVTDGSKLTGTITATNATTATTTTGNAGTATALQTARNINGISFNGTADITVTATPTAGSVVDASISSTLSPSKITGTAINQAVYNGKWYQTSTIQDVPSRLFATSTIAAVSGTVRGWFFTADQSTSYTKISTYVATAANWTANSSNTSANVGGSSGSSGGFTITMTNTTWTAGVPYVGNAISGTGIASGAKITAVSTNGLTITVDLAHTGAVSGTITLTQVPQAKAALFSVSGTTLTPLATSTTYTLPYTTANAFYDFTIASTALTAGTTYAVGVLLNWGGTPTTTPTNASSNLQSSNNPNLNVATPRMTFFVASLTDIPATYDVPSTSATYAPIFHRLQ